MTVSGVPNIRVILREAEEDNLLVDVPNLTVKVIQDSSYNVNTTQPVTVTFFSGSYNRFADVALLAYTASYVQSAANAVSSSYALTSSYAINAGSGGFPFSGSAVITGSLIVSQSGITVTGSVNITDNLTVEGIISAEKLLVSSSVIYESGSTKFGDSPEDTHQFTGSVLVQGPISASSGITGSFKGDGSQLTGIVTDLRISGSTGIGIIELKTEDLLITGSKGISVDVTGNTVTVDVPTGLTASLYGTASVADGIDVVIAGIYETGSEGVIIPSPSGGLIYITTASYALTASYISNNTWNNLLNIPDGLVSSSNQVYYFPVLTAISSSYATTASYALNSSAVPAGTISSSAQVIASLPAGTVSSSLQINTGSFTGSFTGSITGTITSASFATTSSFSISSSRATTASFGISASYAANADLLDGLNSTVFATTASNTFNGNQTITGSLLTNADTLIFTGSIFTSGSISVTAGTITGSLLGTSSWASNIISSSYSITASYIDGGYY